MEKNRQEFLENACGLYITAILAVLPLFTRGTYWKLGDDKYLFFRNITLLCLAIWMVIGAANFLLCKRRRLFLSTVDWGMLIYGGCVLLSYLCSSYREIAWNGYRDWYMGALSQFLFVAVYFFISRTYRGAALPVYLGEAALFAVTVIGILQRLDIDPLKLLAPYGRKDWEYQHMLSTLGNINWLCGYYTVALAFAVTGFLYGKGRLKTGLLYAVSVLSMLLLCIQGSDSGIAIAVVCLGICFVLGMKKSELFLRGLFLGAGTILLLPVMSFFVFLRKSQEAFPIESNTYAKMAWMGWLPIGIILLFFGLLMKRMSPEAKRRFAKGMLCLLGILALIAMCCFLFQAGDKADWGSGRGRLWSLAWNGFLQGDWKQKLLGAGPDCFAEYIYRVFPAKELLEQQGHWADAIFTNAHNEWLNQLVNTGILGMAAYGGIFICSFLRYRRMPLAMFALSMYGVNSLVSFQQTVSTPLLFLVLGMCESRRSNCKAQVQSPSALH